MTRGIEVSSSDSRRLRKPRKGTMHEKDMKYLEKNRQEIYARNRERYTMRKWGLTREEYDARAYGICPICAIGPQVLHYDHDHATGTLREFICQKCNHALGLFNDNPEVMRKAAEYVASFRHTKKD